MKIEIFGMTFGYTHIIILILISSLITHLLIGCFDCVEGMQLMHSLIEYKMGEGVNKSWENKEQGSGPSLAHRQQNHDSYSSKFVGPEQSLNFFSNTDFAPECCPSNYNGTGGVSHSDGSSTGGGCACMNTQQIEYINTRGGNRNGGDF